MGGVSELVFVGGVREDGLPAALSDPARLAQVAATGLLDTAAEDVFDDLAELAAAATGCDRAFVTMVDDDRSFWKSCVGVDLAPDDVAGRQGAVRESFCYFLVGLAGDPFVVEDAAVDPRTRDHPSVDSMSIGAWAGYPIMAPDGSVLGSMCVIDHVPHPWRSTELKTLATLARSVGNEIALRQSLATTRTALAAITELARDLQNSLLPPVLPAVPGLDTAATYLPATGDVVLGDFFDLFPVGNRYWTAVLGDVCGHGVEAAKLTAMARYTLRAEATRGVSPAAVLARLNTEMIAQRGRDRFLSVIQAIFEPSSEGVIGRLCSAGHPPALILRADGSVDQLGRGGTVLGLFDDVPLVDVAFEVGRGELLLLYTDGAVEARARPGGSRVRDEFGEDALARALTDCRHLDAAATLTHLTDVLATHTRGWAADDTALMAIRLPSR